MAKQDWNDLALPQRRLILAGAAVEALATAVVLADLLRRPSAGVRGPKWAWALGCAVQPFGPIAYTAFGRR